MYDAHNHHDMNQVEIGSNTSANVITRTTDSTRGKHNINSDYGNNGYEESSDVIITRMLQQKLDVAHSVSKQRLTLKDIERKIKEANEENDKDAAVSTKISGKRGGNSIQRGISGTLSSASGGKKGNI